MENHVADGIFIDNPPERVFQSLLDAEEILIWLDARQVEIDARQGGTLRATRWDDSVVEGRITRLEAPSRLELGDYTWSKDGVTRGPMSVSFELESRLGGVWFIVRQGELDQGEDWKPFARETLKEWRRSTLALKRHLDQI